MIETSRAVVPSHSLFLKVMLYSTMDLSLDGILPILGKNVGLTRVNKLKRRALSARIFTQPLKPAKAKHHPTFLSLRQHMLGSIFCGEYPLEMRQSRRMRDA